MSTTTTRLALTKPAPADSMATGGSVLSANYDILDAAVGAPTYTSGTRPGSPWVGRVIFESDTNNLRFWNGTKWAFLGNTNNGFGKIGAVDQTELTNTGPAEKYLGSIEFPVISNRRYLIDYITYAKNVSVVADSYQVLLRWSVGATPVTTAGTLLLTDYSQIVSTASLTVGKTIRGFYEWDYTSTSQTVSVGVFAVSGSFNKSYNTETGTTDIGGHLVVRDWSIH